MMVETCALNCVESLYNASEFTAPVRAAKPISRVLKSPLVISQECRAEMIAIYRFLTSWSADLDSALLRAENLRKVAR